MQSGAQAPIAQAVQERSHIETGVDRLVKLVNREKKIEINDAAKELGVPVALVQEWADFLEQEGLLDAEYSLYKSYLLVKRMSKDDVAAKGKEYEVKKDAFIRKVDVALERLEREAQSVQEFKDRYEELRRSLGDDWESVQEEIDRLRFFHDLKSSMEQELVAKKSSYDSALSGIHSRISTEEERYAKILEQAREEERAIEHETKEVDELSVDEESLIKRTKAMQELVAAVLAKLSDETGKIRMHEERLKQLHKLAAELQEEVAARRKKEIEPLLKVTVDQTERIKRIEKEIMDRIRQKLDQGRGLPADVEQQLKDFFQQRGHIEQAVRSLEEHHVQMRKELIDLILKAKAFDIASATGTNSYIKELEGKFHEFEEQKKEFAAQAGALHESGAPAGG